MAVDPSSLLARVGIEAGASVRIEPLPHNAYLTPGVWRVSTGERTYVLKWLGVERDVSDDAWARHCADGCHDPRRWNFWRREALVYRHDLVGQHFGAAGIEAPAAAGVSETDSDAVLLLDFAEGTPADDWDIADYADAARRLGRAQGSLVSATPAPDHLWLSRRYLREYSTEKPVRWSLLDDDDAWNQPLVRENFPAELRAAAGRLHRSSERLVALVESLPRTLCHLDFWTKNLIRRDDGTLVVIDWAFAGDGALGEDAGNLVPDAAFDHFVTAASLPDLEREVLDAYVGGCRDAGWSGDRRLVELAMLASAVKYDWLTPAMLASATAETQVRYGGGAIDADYKYRERGLALLHNANAAMRALDLATRR